MTTNPSYGSRMAGLRPDRTRRRDHQRKLRALVLLGERVSRDARGETALRADGEPVEIDSAGRFFDSTFQCVQALQRRRFAADEAEDDALAVRHEPQRPKVARARRVVFEEEVIDVGAGEEPLGNRLVAAGAEIVAAVVA